MTENQKGRTVWDLVHDFSNRGGHWLHFIFVIQTVILLGLGYGFYSGYLSFGSRESFTSGSPFVYWSIIESKIITSPRCAALAHEVLQLADPKKVEAPNEEEGAYTRVADFGSSTGWISCIESRENILMYVGASAADNSDAKNKLYQLETVLKTRLPIGRKAVK
jgi:hypothetical protein